MPCTYPSFCMCKTELCQVSITLLPSLKKSHLCNKCKHQLQRQHKLWHHTIAGKRMFSLWDGSDSTGAFFHLWCCPRKTTSNRASRIIAKSFRYLLPNNPLEAAFAHHRHSKMVSELSYLQIIWLGLAHALVYYGECRYLLGYPLGGSRMQPVSNGRFKTSPLYGETTLLQ